MDKNKRKALEAKGWKIGSTQDFLELSDEEMAYVDTKLELAQSLKERRQGKHFTQAKLAKMLKSSQSRVAKMEAGDPSVSIDLLVRALFVLGASRMDLAKTLAAPKRRQKEKIAS
ncbi:MAG: helix-turn-helix transcriptional regulator [Actinomycetota bacterium]|jgi:predicted transcriptional regulator|nr:helix-turn-helix domain-containing protein [Actinomycetota bacterium]MCL6092529.1 helix-turn-helix domain-containing protein [Actinomycetota bacterium]MDA8167540.1 helix-turn-helix transcriptional regulator [Actinomycetota bacterium]